MIVFNISYTEPINCSDPSTPYLTQEQVWKGLELKARYPQIFIPAFDDSRVIEERDKGTYIVREAHVSAHLHESPMAGKWTREECRLHKPVMTHFNLPGGSTIYNIISPGPGQDLYLTFTYEWRFPDIEPGSAEAKKAQDDHMGIAISSVQGTIKALRTMAGEHKL